ncbi:hypothetical protein TRICHSKD4_3483 [Roseibium sp. TrichSKD4]|nr:hypothetical protein TRICHSKD4_3483 [Roseibium sp. TrichSKD4]
MSGESAAKLAACHRAINIFLGIEKMPMLNQSGICRDLEAFRNNVTI